MAKTRVIIKNPSAVSFRGSTFSGVKSVTIGASADVDRSRADNEQNAVVFAIQNKTVTAEVEVGDLNTIVKKFSVGNSGAFSASGDAKYPSGGTSVSLVIRTMYCESIDIDISHGEEASGRATFSGNPPISWS